MITRYWGIVFFILFCCIGQNAIAEWSEVTVSLTNGKQIVGSVIQEEADYILLNTEWGELRVARNEIAKIADTPFAHLKEDSVQFNDQVVVHLENGKIVDGFLIAKSRTMIMIQSEMGRLTIPKKEVRRIEYVSTPFAEQGEPVLVELVNGKTLEGYLHSEDRSSLTIIIELGKLTISKRDLRGIRYNISPKFDTPDQIRQERDYGFASTTEDETPSLEKQQDVFGIGYSANFGDNYDNGVVLSYSRRLQLKKYDSFSINGLAGIDLPYFGIDQDVFGESSVPGGTTVEGYALVPSLYLGVPIILYPRSASHYRFVITPQVNFHLVRTSLDVSYPSFPSLDTSESKTSFQFGVGANLKFEWDISQSLTVGVGFNPNVLFGDDDYSATLLYIGVPPLY